MPHVGTMKGWRIKARRCLSALLTASIGLASNESLGQSNVEPPPRVVQASVPGWRDLKIGMTEGKVRQLLGRPSKVDSDNDTITWRYGSPVYGLVFFDRGSRKVSMWTGPLEIVTP